VALFVLAIFVGLFAPWLAHTDPVMDANLMNGPKSRRSWILVVRHRTRKARDILTPASVPRLRASRLTVGIVFAARQQRHRRDNWGPEPRGYWGGWWDDVRQWAGTKSHAGDSLAGSSRWAIMAVLGPGLDQPADRASEPDQTGRSRAGFARALRRLFASEGQGYVQAARGARLRRSCAFMHHAGWPAELVGPIIVIGTLGMGGAGN